MRPSGRLVLAEDDNDWYAIGPVRNDDTVDRIRDMIEDRGDTNRGTVVLYSLAQFRDEQ